MAERSAELLAVLQDVLGRRERTRPACEIVPSAHESRSVHMDEGVGDVKVFCTQFIEERLVSQAEPTLVQIVDVRIAGVPTSRRKINETLKFDSCAARYTSGNIDGG